jgi:hypothetical protein
LGSEDCLVAHWSPLPPKSLNSKDFPRRRCGVYWEQKGEGRWHFCPWLCSFGVKASFFQRKSRNFSDLFTD